MTYNPYANYLQNAAGNHKNSLMGLQQGLANSQYMALAYQNVPHPYQGATEIFATPDNRTSVIRRYGFGGKPGGSMKGST